MHAYITRKFSATISKSRLMIHHQGDNDFCNIGGVAMRGCSLFEKRTFFSLFSAAKAEQGSANNGEQSILITNETSL